MSANGTTSLSTATAENTLRFGPFDLVRELEPSPLAERWLALHERDHSSHVVYRLPVRHDRAGQRRFFHAVESLVGLKDSHLLEIEQYAVCSSGRGIIVTPYTGNQERLVTLESLATMKGGRLSPHETDRAATHLLEGLAAAHAAPGVGACHGPLTTEQLLVDRHGRVVIELYGLANRLRNSDVGGADAGRDEVRSVGAIAYRLLTGTVPQDSLIPADRLSPGLSKPWLRWLERALDSVAGFDSALEALAFLPSNIRDLPDEPARGAVRTVLDRFGWRSGAKK